MLCEAYEVRWDFVIAPKEQQQQNFAEIGVFCWSKCKVFCFYLNMKCMKV